MIPLLIVDDEAAIREAIARMVQGRYPGRFDICLAENGKRALEIASFINFRLIITDIKMPVIPGLDMMQRLRELRFEGELIVISGFDDYELVRTAMKLGAGDYLLKPIDANEFYMQLDAFLDRESRRLTGESTLKSDTPLLQTYRQQYVLDELLNTAPDGQLTASLGLDPAHPLILCLMESPADAAAQSLQAAWSQLMAPLLRPGCHLLQGKWQKYYITVYLYQTRQDEQAFRYAKGAADSRGITLAVAPPRRLSDIRDSLDECLAILNRAFYDLPAQDGPEQPPYPALTRAMTDAMTEPDAEVFERALSTLLARACAQLPPPDSLRQTLSAMFYALMQRDSLFIRLIARHELTDSDMLRLVSSAPSASVLQSGMLRIAGILMQEAAGHLAERNEQHIARAQHYIRAHFREDLSLSDAAGQLCLHPNYFSTLFKQRSGISFSRYLRRVRIEEACRLLRAGTMKINEIARAVGYPEQVQFNRAFRAETGRSPSGWRQRHEQG